MRTFHGFGLGLRRPHYDDFTAGVVHVDFVEIISENYMVDGGKPLAVIDAVRAHYPVAMHGVSLSVGSVGGLDLDHLARLKRLAERIEPLWISDHLCWTRTSAHNSHDLLPLPYTEEALGIVCANLSRAQDVLGRELLLENPSSYCGFAENEMSEWEFLAEVCSRTGCHLLLDVNNVHVSARNHGFDPERFLAGIPIDRVRQIHLAGHTPGEILIDTHDREVCGDLWTLYAHALEMVGAVATMIERDDAIPPLDDLLTELDIARGLASETERRAA
jgi:uncharacterized protein (UPF0276 family)